MEYTLVGRDAELATLRAIVARAAEGRGGAVVVEGEPGSGKSRLVDEALTGTVGVQTVRARAREYELSRPVAPIADALDLPTIAETRGAVEACIAAVEDLALDGPVVLVVDDVQWADAGTVGAITAIVRRITSLPLIVVLVRRPTPMSPVLAALLEQLRTDGAATIVLEPLDTDAIAALVTEVVAGGQPGPNLMRLAAGAAGNPFFLLELLSALEEEHGLERVGRVVDTVDDTLPAGLRQTILRRLAGLPEETLATVQLAAVLGPVFDFDELATLVNASPSQLVGVVEPARKAGVLGETGDQLAFRHDLVHEAVYDDLPQSVRRALHGEVGRMLAGADANPARVAHHLAIGAGPGDREAVTWLRRGAAGREAQSVVEMLDRALELLGDDPTTRTEVIAEEIEALVAVGRLGDVRARADEALATTPPPAVEAELRVGLGEALLREGAMPAALEEFLAAATNPAVPEVRRARIRAKVAVARVWSGDYEGAHADAAVALEAGERLGDGVAATTALAVQCVAASREARYDEAIETGRAATARASVATDLEATAPHLYLGQALLVSDHIEEAQRTLRDGLRRCEGVGDASGMLLYANFLTLASFVGGAWDDAVAEADAGRVLAQDIDEPVMLQPLVGLRGLVAANRGEFDTARTSLDDARTALAVEPGQVAWSWVGWLDGLLLEDAGDGEAAAREAQRAFESAEGSVFPLRLWIAIDAARMLMAVDQVDAARGISSLVAELADGLQTPGGRAATDLAEGTVIGDASRLGNAVAAYDAAGLALGSIHGRVALGEVLVQSGERDAAVSVYREALSRAEAIGAVPVARRLVSRLQGLGARSGNRAPRPATGWDSLTPTELQVVGLVTEGLSNPQIGERLFISRRTVSTHLSHVFLKLGVKSRTELAAAAASEARV